MKKGLLSLLIVLTTFNTFSQLIVTTPQFPTESVTPVEILMDGSYGNKALYNYTSGNGVFVHIGVITNLSTSNSDWRYVRPGNFNQAVPALQATQVGSVPFVKYRFTINGGIRSYFGVPAGETILRIAVLFRSHDGTKVQRNADGSDMYIKVNDGTLDVKFTNPFFQPVFNPIPEPIIVSAGGSLPITAVASAASNMRILFDGTQIQSAAGVTTISATQTGLVAGSHTVTAEAISGVTRTSSFNFFVPAANTIQELPAGVRNGINYEADQTAATLVLYAPGKGRATVIGDFPGSNWQEQLGYQMKKTASGDYFWIRLTGLTPGTEYSFQYLVDGNLRIGEAYAEKILDPWNDQYILNSTYPSIKPYPTGLTSGIVSILQTNAATYTWQNTSFSRPDKRNVMVYELLLRDFIAEHDWNTMEDTLNYLKKLGINTIELMPINEFEGNNSWGYNPDYYFAPDKYYGPKNDLKKFVDMAHGKGIAVVMDIALNHSFGLSPMVQLYWDAVNNRPAANNPWYNPVAKHPFNVGYDFNHESLATKAFFSRVVEHWLTEYKMDGFRFDLSKGFTQTQTCDGSGNNCNVSSWSAYDASRVEIWRRYNDTLQLKSPGSYVILEHFADNNEEIALSNMGMLLWGNVNHNFSEAAMGWLTESDFNSALHVTRGWSNPHLVGYMESHDEERMMYRNTNFGNQTNPAHDTRSLPIATQRMGMSASFLLSMPGPKMIWQFGELGYDYSINQCETPPGGISNDCRLSPKPIRWDYLLNTDRKKLHDVYAGLLQLRQNPTYATTFTTGVVNRNFANNVGFKWMTIDGGAGKLVVIGNFDVTAQTGSVTFPAAGTWYNYLSPINGGTATFAATGGSQSFTLQPGEYRVYINTAVALPVTIVNFSGRSNDGNNLLSWQVENEINVVRYELQRSTDGTHFENIGLVSANGSRNYSYTDNDISLNPVYFYRLKTYDADGTYNYSSIIKLGSPVKSIRMVATPNPFRQDLRLEIAMPVAQTAQLVLTDIYGKMVFQQQVSLQSGVNAVRMTHSEKLAAGTYVLTMTTSQNKTTLKVVKAE
jgi:1,4-alpha-glucan branching enzyme